MPRFVRIGRMISPEVMTSTSTFADGESGLVIGNVGDPTISRRLRRMFTHGPIGPSRAAARRATGDPRYFMGGGSTGSGALFVDTDGHRIQDGDDF